MKTLQLFTFKRLWSFLLALLIMVSAQAAGNNYFVNAGLGSNTNDGLSPASAFLTIQKAADKAIAGDTVLVSGGNYSEMIVPANSGLTGKPIVFKRMGESTVTINGDSIRDFGFDLSNKSNISIESYTFVNQKQPAINISAISLDVNNIDIKYCDFNNYHIAGNPRIAVLIKSGPSHRVQKVNIEYCVFSGGSVASSKVISIEGSNSGFLNDNISISNCQFSMVYMNPSECIVSQGYTTNLFITANKFFNANALSIKGDTARNIYFVNNYNEIMMGPSFGVKADTTTYENVNILYNTFKTMQACFKGYANGIKLVNNIMQSNIGECIYALGASVNRFDVCDYNLYYTTNNSQFFWNSSSYTTFGTFQSSSHSLVSSDAHSIFGYPFFNGTFEVNANSPAVDSAMVIKQGQFGIDVKRDIVGKVRDNFSPTIGAYELPGKFQGVYTIGGPNGDYLDFYQAISALGMATLNGPVVFNVQPGVYNERIILGTIAGASPTNTIAFIGKDSASTILAYDAGESYLPIIDINTSSYITIRNLGIHIINSAYGNCVNLDGQIDSLSFENCWFKGVKYALPSIMQGGASVTLKYFMVKNCLFEEGASAIAISPEGAGCTNFSIANNIFKNQEYESLSLRYIDSMNIIGNKVFNDNATSKNIFDLYNINHLNVSSNIIRTANGNIGMYFNSVQNTLISNNNLNIGALYATSVAGMFIEYSNPVEIFHNTIQTLNSNARGLHFGNGDVCSVKNNIIAAYNAGVPLSVDAETSIVAFEYNNMISTSEVYAFIEGTNYYSSTELMANPKYKFITNYDPVFTNGDVLIPLSCNLSVTGANLQSTVSLDILGKNRPTTPSLGAVEYSNTAISGGTINVGKNGKYATLSDALKSLPSCATALSGPLTLLLTDSFYLETGVLNVKDLSMLSSTNRLIIKPATGVKAKIIFKTNSSQPFLFADCSYITLDGSNNGTSSRDLEIEALNTDTYMPSSALVFTTNTKNSEDIEVKNCILTGSAGMSMSSGALSISANLNSISNVRILNNQIQRSAGITVTAMQTNNISNIHIEKNIIGSTDTTMYIKNTGISISNANDIDILDNEVFNVRSIMYDPQGISIANVYNMRIERNYLHDIIKTGNGGALGINLKPADLAKISIVNNKISHIASFGSGYTKTQNPIGIIIDISSSSVALASDSINIYHNSIYMNADAVNGLNATDSSFAIGLFVSNPSAYALTNKINFRNNIIQVSLGEKTGSTTLSWGYAVYSSSTNNPFNQLSNNVYFVSGFDYNNVGFLYNAEKSDLANWQTSSGKDAASYFQDPLYTSTLNLKPLSNSIANNHGFGGLAATDDMLVVRNLTTPDIGAIEFEALTIVTQPVAATYCLGAPASLSVITNMPGLSTYQWQTRSTDTTAWVIIPGATSNVYSYTTAVAGTKQYQCKVSAVSNLDVLTTPVKHIINSAPTITISVSDNSGKTNNDGIICSGDAATITATGTGVDVYSWSSGETLPSITKKVAGTFTVTGTSSLGCTVNASTTIQVRTKPTVNAGADVSICDGGSTNLSATSAGSLVYAWSPATGLSSTSTLTTSAKPTATTSYIIAVTDTNACFAKDTVVVTVNTINADFASKVDTINKLKISFSSASPGVTDYSWAFGDDNNSNEKTPVHTYAKNGVYEVCLNTYNSSTACAASSCTNVIVGGNDPAFVAAKYSYTVDGLKVTFTDSSTNASQYYWVFGDGGFSTAKNPVYTYKKAGNYKVCLKVFNKAYGTVADNCAVVIAGTPTCNSIAAFTYSIDTANNVTFANTSTGSINAYYWDFGNDKTSSAKNPKFKYTKAGFYFVSLAVRDTLNGCASYTSDMVKIGSVNCRANFDADIDAVNKSVKFINNSEGTVAHYFWLFGDKDYSTSATPTHSFAKAGLYNVSLTVADATGSCVDYFEKTIQIGTADCNARYTYYVDSTALKAYFYSSDLDDNTQKYWLFGDGKLSLEANPSHSYPAAGFYNVSLTTYNATNSCMDYYQEIVLVGSLGKDCEADFAFTNQDNSQKIKFIDKSKGDIKSWQWNFGDQSPSTLQNPEHVFNTTGFFNVCLTVVNNFGISNISCNSVAVGTTVQNNCKADFSYYTDTVTRKVSFTDNSFGTIDAYHWEFGDGSTASTKNTEHTYATAGYYLVYQEIGNTVKKCSDVSLKLLNVAQPNKFKVVFKYIMNPYSKKAGGYPVDLAGAGLGDDARLKWDFGDGQTDSTTNSPTHVYTDTAIREYNVCLTYSDPITGAEDTYCEKVTADQLCLTDINAPTAKCKPTFELILDATGHGSVTASQLDDGSFDDCYLPLENRKLSKTAFTTADIGNNKVKFIVTDVKGNADTIETTIVVKAATGMDNINSAVNLSVYPNPIDKMLNIRYNLLHDSEIELYVTDLLGKRVASIYSGKLTAGEKTITFDASALQSGSYILQLRAANGPISQRIIVKR